MRLIDEIIYYSQIRTKQILISLNISFGGCELFSFAYIKIQSDDDVKLYTYNFEFKFKHNNIMGFFLRYLVFKNNYSPFL